MAPDASASWRREPSPWLPATGSSPLLHGISATGLEYALEGSVFIGGAVVQWLRDELRILSSSAESETMSRSVPDTAGVYFVPAFVGMGAPYWDPDARGALFGITRGTRQEHIVRAGLESIAFQTRDLVEAMERDAGRSIRSVRVDGGASINAFLMQFQSDILGMPLVRPRSLRDHCPGRRVRRGTCRRGVGEPGARSPRSGRRMPFSSRACRMSRGGPSWRDGTQPCRRHGLSAGERKGPFRKQLAIAAKGNRTPDTRIFSPLLYRLSYSGDYRHISTGGREKVKGDGGRTACAKAW